MFALQPGAHSQKQSRKLARSKLSEGRESAQALRCVTNPRTVRSSASSGARASEERHVAGRCTGWLVASDRLSYEAVSRPSRDGSRLFPVP